MARIAPSVRRRKAAANMVENGGNASKALRDAGYSEAIANNPQKVTKTQSFAELCDELGLTNDLIVRSLVEDIKKKPQERKPELELAAKIRGLMVERTEVEAIVNHTYRPNKLPAGFDELDRPEEGVIVADAD